MVLIIVHGNLVCQTISKFTCSRKFKYCMTEWELKRYWNEKRIANIGSTECQLWQSFAIGIQLGRFHFFCLELDFLQYLFFGGFEQGIQPA